MTKIDYSKVEREMKEALHRLQAKHLAQGKSITSKRASDFFGLDEPRARPVPEDPVVALLGQEAAKHLSQPTQACPEAPTPPQGLTASPPCEDGPKEEVEEREQAVLETPKQESLYAIRPQAARTPKPSPPALPQAPYADAFLEDSPPLYVLRQHILWLKRRHLDNRYELLGTTRDEVMAFRRAPRLTKTQLQRVLELNARAQQLRTVLLSEEASGSDTLLVKKQTESHVHKRFNVKDGWMPL